MLHFLHLELETAPDISREGQSDLFARQYGVGRGREPVRLAVEEGSGLALESRKVLAKTRFDEVDWKSLPNKADFEKQAVSGDTSPGVTVDTPTPDRSIPPEGHARDTAQILTAAEHVPDDSSSRPTQNNSTVMRPTFTAQVKAAQNVFRSRNVPSLSDRGTVLTDVAQRRVAPFELNILTDALQRTGAGSTARDSFESQILGYPKTQSIK